MADTVRLHWAGRTGRHELKARRRYVKVFIVITDSFLKGPLHVLNLPGIPRVGDTYVEDSLSDPGAVCFHVDPKNDGDYPSKWMVIAEYDSTRDAGTDRDDPDPTKRPVEIEGDWAVYQKPLDKDQTGKKVANSATEPFDPPINIDDDRPIIRMTRFERDLNYGLVLAYRGAINSDQWWIWEPRQAKIRIRFRNVKEAGEWLWLVTYEFEIAEDWTIKVPDRGYSEYRGAVNFETGNAIAPKRVQIKDPVTRETIQKPIFLDGNGGALDEDATGPVMLDFKGYKEMPFVPLNLPE